jgi:thiosulfate/3-mercaptopyruvate sulfurtransferase
LCETEQALRPIRCGLRLNRPKRLWHRIRLTAGCLVTNIRQGMKGDRMRHFLRRWSIALAIALMSTTGHAASPRERLLVSTAWLAEHLGDRDLVLLHVSDKAEYQTAHIPGARFAETRDLSVPPAPGGLTLEMAPPETLRGQLEALGVSDTSHVVVYYGKDWVSPTTRVIFTLLYAGLDNVSLLDGGMGAWTKEGRAVTTEIPAVAAGHLSPLETKPLIVDADFVRSHTAAAGFAVVDTRDKGFYDGTQEGGPRDHRKSGHIAGARSVPFGEIVTEDLKLKSAADLEAVFEKAGVRPGDTVITYCHVGQQATAPLFGALTLGHPVLLYDGSFEDWARRDLPIENPSAKKQD